MDNHAALHSIKLASYMSMVVNTFHMKRKVNRIPFGDKIFDI